MNESQLKTYYEKLQSEYTYSLKKKDTLEKLVTYGTFSINMSVYFNIIKMDVINEIKILFTIGTLLLIILIQFFVNSMLAYGYLRKWRKIMTGIEKYWMDKSYSYEEITEDIREYDHNGKLSITWKDMIWAQLLSGFLIILLTPIFFIIYEIYTIGINSYSTIGFIILGIFIIWEIITMSTYSKFKKRVCNARE